MSLGNSKVLLRGRVGAALRQSRRAELAGRCGVPKRARENPSKPSPAQSPSNRSVKPACGRSALQADPAAVPSGAETEQDSMPIHWRDNESSETEAPARSN